MTQRKVIKIVWVVLSAIILSAIVILISIYWHAKDKIYPGISVAFVNVGQLTQNQAQTKLDQVLNQPNSLIFTYQTNRFQIPFADIGLQYDTIASAKTAYEISWQTWISANQDLNLEPIYRLDEEKLKTTIASISAQINIPAQDPQIKATWQQVGVTAGENGQEVDERQLLQLVAQALKSNRILPIELPVRKLKPKLSDEQIEIIKTRASKLLSKKLVLTLDGLTDTWDIYIDNILAWLGPEGWRQDKIAQWVDELAQTANRPAQNANFRFVAPGKVEEFRAAQPGITIKQPELVNSLITKLQELEIAKDLSLKLVIPADQTQPTIKNSDVNNLGITELIGRGESDYSGSIPNRVFNVHKAASIINGILVGPDEIFSFNKYIGDISAATGYKQAYVIKNGRTVLGDGGGVCQVSSTLFRAALDAGLPIEERWAHAYRVHYYENDSQPGFDATVFAPSIDLKFKNDTGHYILVQSEVIPSKNRLNFNIYGTKDGRKIEISKARVWDVTPPPPTLYQDDPTLPVGVVTQVDWSAWGAKAAFDWKVTRGDEILQQRTFYSNFRPWQAIFLRGTRT